ncbi:UVB-resistance protein UVR8 [Thecamonas trahens ATCC 50062]|uniref:UVB-resistance protein UVR8 n=1 Tax=Thecamonas trahens ATCC 50062 TaxID=461836 RepID=A0A0L0DKJ7_THETB|nr:UVB-resistance protein UVR8 [Thecamonas trahens ATCC 50062]KNC52822.1 UVB-resistance protein UVR8 [Thecamonas trahens ATCC 50062]|eukprot:XP_013754928.1 UVB-resistance protein UVR8 [Thecamonas trahens ATCC 50062]
MSGNAVLVCGHNYWGQLGLSPEEYVEAFETDVTLATGERSTGRLGGHKSHGGLGHDGGLGSSSGGGTSSASRHHDEPPATLDTFTELELPPGLNVISAVAGDAHTVLLSDAGEVYTFGCGRSGQLGHGDTLSSPQPRRVAALDGVRIVKIAAGAQVTLAVSEPGRLYMMGTLQRYSYTGEVRRTKLCLPTLVQGLASVDIVDVVCGGWHVLALDITGRVYSFGWNKACQLGLGDSRARSQPRLVKVLRNHKVVQIAAGRQHSLVLLEEGFVVGWGSNRYGALGGVPAGFIRKPQLVDLNVCLPPGYTFLPSSIHAGHYTSFVAGLASRKRGSSKPKHAPRTVVFATGHGTDGQLGSGRLQTQRMFTRFKLPHCATPRKPLARPAPYTARLPDAGPVVAGDVAVLAQLAAEDLLGSSESDDDWLDDPSPFAPDLDSDSDSEDEETIPVVGGGAGPFKGVCLPRAAVVARNTDAPKPQPGRRTPPASHFPLVDGSQWHSMAVKRGAVWATGWGYGGRLGFTPLSLSNCDTLTDDVFQRNPVRVPLPPNLYALDSRPH